MKETLVNISLLCASLIISMIGAEMFVRFLGYQPWKSQHVDKNEPIMHEYDSIIGWINKEGEYRVPPYHTGGQEIQITFLKNGLRIAHEKQQNVPSELDKLIFVGGSFTQGWAISDDETYPWKVQQRFPFIEVLNYGTGGYGTYQSLLTLERILPHTNHPKMIIYGFIGGHENRNIAPYNWMAYLSSYSRRGHAYVPYVTLSDNGELCRHPPESCISSWPLTKELAVIALGETFFMKLRSFGRWIQKRVITEQLMLSMQSLCKKYHAELVIAMLLMPDDLKRHYSQFCQQHNIMVVDCIYTVTDQLIVKGEGHPNGEMNSQWAGCIVDFINANNLLD